MKKQMRFFTRISPDASSFKVKTASQKPSPKSVSGAIALAKVDLEHWLSAGLKQELHSLVSGSAIYTPIREDKGTNVVRFAAAEKLAASGFYGTRTGNS